MGFLGAILGQEGGAVGGREASGAIAKHFGAGKHGQEVARNVGSRVGRFLGGAAGSLLPFRQGGYIPGKPGMPHMIMGHNEEFILPVGVKPTKSQIQAVKKRGGRYKKK